MEVWEQLKDLTECCVCSETFKDPKILPCIHTFCVKCLEDAGAQTSRGHGDQMPCPVCRKNFTIPVEGYASLQRNFFMEALIETAKIANPSEDPDLCEACMEQESTSTSASEVSLAVLYCTDCQIKLCEKCSRCHIKKQLTKNHQFAAASDLKCKAQAVALSNCIKHKRELDLYCSDCKSLLCKLCFGEGHQNHRLQSTGNVVKGLKDEIKSILSGLEVCETNVLDKKASLNSGLNEYCKNLETLKYEVDEQMAAVITLVSEHANLVMRDIDKLNVQKQNEVKNEIEDSNVDLMILKSFKDYCARVMRKGSARDICCTTDELKARFEVFKTMYESKVEVKTDFRNTSFQMSKLEELGTTADYNIIGTIEECQTEVKDKNETKAASDKVSHDGDRNMAPSCNNGIPAKINHSQQKLENKSRRKREFTMEKKAGEKRVQELELEGVKRARKSFSALLKTQAAELSSKLM